MRVFQRFSSYQESAPLVYDLFSSERNIQFSKSFQQRQLSHTPVLQ
jgi:hypothetical protein